MSNDIAALPNSSRAARAKTAVEPGEHHIKSSKIIAKQNLQ
jgi:hypothetical protein